MKTLILIAAATVLTGCASPSQWMVNNDGNQVRCAATGWGVVGMIVAKGYEKSCVSDYKKVGYREMSDPE
jgi:uncharacterized lipoprotein YajG